MLSLDQALAHYAQLKALSTQQSLALEDAHGRVLATDLTSTLDLPPMRQSAMDGYAVHASDLRHAATQPVELPVTQSIAAGDTPRPLPAGQCARIFTGAPLPDGADSVEIQENVLGDATRAVFTQTVQSGRHVRQRGEEVQAGQVLLHAGQRLNAARLSIAAGAGHAQVPCRAQPRVAIIVSGSELVAPGSERGPAQIFESNGSFLAHFVRDQGARVSRLTRCPDDPAQLSACVAAALDDCDMLLISGGASVGDHDHSRAACQANAVHELFWKVAQKPGKPLSFGRGPDGQAVFVLPGNPASVYACAMLHVRMALAHLCGVTAPAPLHAKLTQPVSGDQRRTRLLRVCVAADASGQLTARPLPHQASHMTSNLASANALARIEAGQDWPAGHIVSCWLNTDLG
ncbi:MAG: molybdopterin molybdenumtransferase MoeA [Oceanococcus sp.]|nr:MAG: molybdopterin molybdenumtransferase MoeA [Oceanococcus sp.]